MSFKHLEKYGEVSIRKGDCFINTTDENLEVYKYESNISTCYSHLIKIQPYDPEYILKKGDILLSDLGEVYIIETYTDLWKNVKSAGYNFARIITSEHEATVPKLVFMGRELHVGSKVKIKNNLTGCLWQDTNVPYCKQGFIGTITEIDKELTGVGFRLDSNDWKYAVDSIEYEINDIPYSSKSETKKYKISDLKRPYIITDIDRKSDRIEKLNKIYGTRCTEETNEIREELFGHGGSSTVGGWYRKQEYYREHNYYSYNDVDWDSEKSIDSKLMFMGRELKVGTSETNNVENKDLLEDIKSIPNVRDFIKRVIEEDTNRKTFTMPEIKEKETYNVYPKKTKKSFSMPEIDEY